MLHFVVTGLSPRTPVSELCVGNKGQLKLGYWDESGNLIVVHYRLQLGISE